MTGIPRRPSITTSTAITPRHCRTIASMSRSSVTQPATVRRRGQQARVPAGISALTGLALTVEIGDWSGSPAHRSATSVWSPPVLSGTRGAGSITKAGNAHVRAADRGSLASPSVLPQPGADDAARWDKGRPRATGRGHVGNRHSIEQWCAFQRTQKHPVVANVAIARELAGWCWSLATMD